MTLLALSADAQDLLFRDAHSTHAFTDQPVTADQVRAIHDLVKLAPTAMNTQPLRLVLLDRDHRDRLLPHLAVGNRAKAEEAPLVAVLAYDVDFHEHLDRTFPHLPAVRSRFAADPDGRAEVARFNATLQAGYFLLGIRAAGLAAGPMGGFDAAGLDADLLAGSSWRSLLVVNIGHAVPDGWHARLPRLSYDEVVRVEGDLHAVVEPGRRSA